MTPPEHGAGVGAVRAEPRWWTCPRCRLTLGAPVVGDDYARICLFCGKAWAAKTPTGLGDELRVPRLVAERLSTPTRKVAS